MPRSDVNSREAHSQLLEKAKAGRIDLYFEGDSIVRRWGATDYPELLANWSKNFNGWDAADFGWGGDTTQNILWRLAHGELDDLHPMVIVLLAGTNNVGSRPPAEGADARAAEVVDGLKAIIRTMQAKVPRATIILTAVLPRNDNPAAMPIINRINEQLAGFADGKRVRFLNINDKLCDAGGKLLPGVMNRDKIHPTQKGYQLWADALKPILTDLLGPRAPEDHAPPPTGDPAARAAAHLIVFNDNGAWCWFQDPRVIHDPANDTLLIASIASFEGKAGDQRAGDVDVVSFRLKDQTKSRVVLHHALLPQDDHNTPALFIRPDGRYLAMYSRHNQDSFSYWRISTRPHDVSQWGPERSFDWTPFLNKTNHVTYHNLFYLSAQKRTYDFSRAANTDPTILTSPDYGDTWEYGGKLLTNSRVGYVNGYTKYASNGVDRIDFITTDHHPRDFNNNIYHGYVRGGKLYTGDGIVVEENVLHSQGRSQTALTKVFAAGTVLKHARLTHAWTVCLRRDTKGRLFALLTARANDEPENSNFSDHRLLYAAFDGGKWHVHEAARLGACLWPAEQDYTGLADVDPAHPEVIYVSTPIDPRDGKPLKRHEIFRGTTGNDGETWAWTALTSHSPVDNLRPIVCSWSPSRRAILWFRGTMNRSQHYDCAIVGIIEHDRQTTAPPRSSPPGKVGQSKG
ncbi:MAG TPA: GDSL-type esterase/lipase family protein [Tepidisphaeraceae bacterium]|nr:GDSL-type esterase/lipase family protein [Tepidisphaeraceae bacterium]